ncbi:thioesterase family protein [Deinococcus ficus]|uniref:acyl-CoA thioesterase n=1 Tax=Deinococcus ficus TaxID=317577 RepID=UPI00041CEDED
MSLPREEFTLGALDWAAFPALRQHEITLTATAADLDDMGHVNNTVYLGWCEAVARAHAASQGMDTPALMALGAVPLARQHTIRYLRPALLGDSVRVRTLLLNHSGPRSTRVYTVDRLGSGEPERLAECRTDWVWVDPATGRPKRAPVEVARRFGLA